MEPTKQELLEFMKKYYGPEWAKESHLKLAKLLWEKKFGKKNIYSVDRNVYKKVEYFSEMGDSGNYEIEVLVINKNMAKYLGCPICKKSIKRNCVHIQQGNKPLEYVSMGLVVSDKNSDMREVMIVCRSDEYKEFDECDTIILYGVVKNSNFYVNDYKVSKRVKDKMVEEVEQVVEQKQENQSRNSGENKNEISGNGDENIEVIKELLQILDNLGCLNKLAFEKMCKDRGVDMNIMKKYVYLSNGRYEVNDNGYKLIGE